MTYRGDRKLKINTELTKTYAINQARHTLIRELTICLMIVRMPLGASRKSPMRHNGVAR